MRPRGGLDQTDHKARLLLLGLLLGLAACGPASSSPSSSASGEPSSASPGPTGFGAVIPAPGSDSRIYAPNPAALVVAIDPGHGGCLDWGVPNPYDNTVAHAEKSLTLAIGLALRDRLRAEGVTVVMTRESDAALAGDDYPDLGCTGDPFRDVNGDGAAGFGSDVPEATRTRDEIAARIDLVNLARAEALLSIHVNSFTENGVVIEIAGTETYWTDETPWGVPLSERLASDVQTEVVAAMANITDYERQDRGTDAVNYYVIAPATTTGDPSEPRRGSLMAGVLAEVGSMSLEAEASLLANADAQRAIAAALADAVAAWFGARDIGARIDVDLPGGTAGVAPLPDPGDGPMYWAPVLDGSAGGPTVTLTLTNTGQQRWGPDAELMAGWGPTDEPYLARPPELAPLAAVIPDLAPGESVHLEVVLPPAPSGGRAVAWVTLRVGGTILSDLGIPALQLASERPSG